MSTAITARVKEIAGHGDRLFNQKLPLLNRWQEIALNFHPLRADFISTPDIGTDWMGHLMTGRPVLAHRDLANALPSMLRPRGKLWFFPRTNNEATNNDAAARKYLDYRGDIMRRAMYAPRANFTQATKVGDYDFIAFGQCVIQVDTTKDRQSLLYSPHHIRDCAWCENEEHAIDEVHRKWKPTVRTLVRTFGDACADKVKEAYSKEPYREIECRHVLMPAGDYDLNYNKVGRRKLPFVSLYIDVENDCILEEVPWHEIDYVIPRWLRPSGSQYAHSMATVIALPDARMLQAMNLTLLEAGEKAVDPPLKATRQAVQGGVNWYPGGVTWVDADYDERSGASLEALMDGPKALDWVSQREELIVQLISEAFYLNKITLPAPADGDKMTAEEVRRRYEEYVRSATPLFEPMETEYNAGLCEVSHAKLERMGKFGSPYDIPRVLQGQEIRWEFDSPLQAAQERAKSQSFLEMCGLLQTAATFDATVIHDVKFDTAFRDALGGSGMPSTWIEDEDKAAAEKQEAAKQEQVANAAAMAAQAGAVAQQVGVGAQEVKKAMAPAPEAVAA